MSGTGVSEQSSLNRRLSGGYRARGRRRGIWWDVTLFRPNGARLCRRTFGHLLTTEDLERLVRMGGEAKAT